MCTVRSLWLEDENNELQDGDLSTNQQGRTASYHDALEFPDGTFVLLTDLHEGQQATVLQLPAQPKTPAEAKDQTRVI